MKRIATEEYRRLLRSVYGAPASRPARSRQASVSRAFDDGSPVPGKVVTSPESAEYDVAANNPGFQAMAYQAMTAGISPGTGITPHPLPVAPEGGRGRANESPAQAEASRCVCPQPGVRTPAERAPTGATPSEADVPPELVAGGGGGASVGAMSGSSRAFTTQQLGKIIKDQELLSDIHSILAGGRPGGAPVPAKPAATPAAPPAQAASNAPAARESELKNEHAIFDRIAKNMQLANAYDLGSFELQRRFDEFDRRAARTPVPVAAAGAPSVSRQYSEPAPPSPATPPAGPAWPPAPTNLRPYTLAEKQAAFGAFEYEPDPERFGGDGVRIVGSWQADNIVDVPIPQLAGKRFGSALLTTGMIRFHRAGQDALINLWRDWESAGLLGRVVSFQGGFAARYIRGTQDRSPRPLSNHAFGTAFDINAEWNAFGAEPALVGQTGCVRELIGIANRHGFYWGGHFHTKDGMHFELAKRV